MIVRPPTFPSWGADMVTTLDAVRCAALRAAGCGFVVRYLDSLSLSERDVILSAGLGLSFVSYAPAGGWHPSAPMGTAGGQAAVHQLVALNIPPGVTVWSDLEGVSADAAPADVAAWANARAAELHASGYDPGLYVGAGAGLSAQQLGALSADRYWRSLSDVPTPPEGYCLMQAFPTTMIGGTAVDVDYVQHDWRGRMPLMVWAD